MEKSEKLTKFKRNKITDIKPSVLMGAFWTGAASCLLGMYAGHIMNGDLKETIIGASGIISSAYIATNYFSKAFKCINEFTEKVEQNNSEKAL